MGKHPSIFFERTIANVGPSSLVERQQVRWRYSKHPLMPTRPCDLRTLFEERQTRRPAPPGDLRREATRAACEIASGMDAQLGTTPSRDGATDRLHGAARFLPLSMQGRRCSLFRSSLGSTMTPNGEPEAGPRRRESSWWTRSIQLRAS
jgi:hypothetical protein